jgi:hypothetical protein
MPFTNICLSSLNKTMREVKIRIHAANNVVTTTEPINNFPDSRTNLRAMKHFVSNKILVTRRRS